MIFSTSELESTHKVEITAGGSRDSQEESPGIAGTTEMITNQTSVVQEALVETT